MLLCPKCKEPLELVGKSYRCKRGHCYDVAKQGYTHLLIHKQKASGDNKEMVQARSAFLEAGYYSCLRDTLEEIVSSLEPRVIVDAGCGEGYYTNAFVSESAEVFAFDMSKYALMKCARRDPRMHCFVASVFDLPLQEGSVDLVTSIFAPFAQDMFARILKNGGYVLKVEPGKRHLYELKAMLYEQVIENEEEAIQYDGFSLRDERLIEEVIQVEGTEMIHALFQMTPYYYRSPKAGVQRLLSCDRLKTTVQFHIELYQKK